MAQDGLSAVEQRIRDALFHQHQLAVREHQRLARDAVSQAVLDSSARLEVTLSSEWKQAQRHNVQCRERNILLRLDNEALKKHFGSKKSIMVHEQHHFVEGGEADTYIYIYSTFIYRSTSSGIGATSIFDDCRITKT